MPAQTFPITTSAKYLLTDSRTVAFPTESVFFAIKTEKSNGHQFVKDLYSIGVTQFVLEASSCTESYLKNNKFLELCNYWVVDSATEALQELAKKHRENFAIPIIGITGSNGKTIVKEWLSQILGQKYIVVKNPKSYNSQIGVPLSVWQLNEKHQFGIFEAGISKPNEMQNLQEVIQPTMGIFTNIGTAHAEFFENIELKIKEKLILFKNVNQLFFCRDNNLLEKNINKYIETVNPNCKLISWSASDGLANSFKFETANNLLTFFDGKRYYTYKLPFFDEASVENICHCIIVAKYLEFEFALINKEIGQIRSIEMRLELKDGTNQTQLIDDSYSNDFIGLKLAIEFLNQQKIYDKKIVIISDILQTDENEQQLYQKITNLIEANKIDLFIGIGPIITKNANLFNSNSQFFYNTESFLDKIEALQLQNATILIKGARAYSFEKIVAALQAKNHDTFLEINLDNLTHNFNYFRKKLPKSTKVMAMVKAFAYGAGNKEIASLLQHIGANYLGVAYTDEGIFLRQNGINLPIMVMNPANTDFKKILEYKLEPEIFSLNKLQKLIEFIENENTFIKVHLKLDTGMHRLGFMANEIDEVNFHLQKNPNIIVASIFSHLVGAENDIHDKFTHNQKELFDTMAHKLMLNIGYKPLLHLLNSAGISRFAEYTMDMVRLGVGMYGVTNNLAERQSLEIVGTLKTKISQIKSILANETVGYGRNGSILNDSRIATIAIGYADGYNRRFGNGVGKVLVNGILCPTIGNICMDMTMIDITQTTANEGDEVIVFGQNPNIYQLAEQIGTIPYEILTNIGERVKRIFYKV